MAIRVGGRGPGHLARVKGVPGSVTVNGVTYTRLRFGNDFLDRLISSQPLYGRV